MFQLFHQQRKNITMLTFTRRQLKVSDFLSLLNRIQFKSISRDSKFILFIPNSFNLFKARELVAILRRLWLLLQFQQNPQQQHTQQLIQRVHATTLQPLGYGCAGLVEAELGEDVVNPIGLQVLGGPTQQPLKERKTFIGHKKINK